MAHSLSAKKRIRQNEKRRSRNNRRKRQVKDAIRGFEDAVQGGDAGQAAEQLKVCYKKLDQIATKGTIHKNNAARKKARLARRLNAISS